MHATDSAPRRNLFGRLAGAFTVGMIGLTSAHAEADTAQADNTDWPGKLTGRHRQLVDAYGINAGFPLAYALTFLQTNPAPGSATSVVVLRHMGFPIALNSEIWAKYKVGEAFHIVDPETKAPAMKNPFLNPKPGVLIVDDMAIDRLLGKGAVFGACHMALVFMSKMLAGNAGLSADEAAKEWTANLVPGVSLIPSGTWGVNRAQEAGCTYCAGG
ncbi:hypothetical protein [Rhodopila globiformis]|uniref:Uncharacterized protein n=1 Tax=Rhodopila globiformis TaxID=1071 RepID=A0A2S6N5R5_RHOGL|nr:hypothetical protein [Rhodopila globiformis]PPQ29942.1 hypothetical protein CCS01_20290 [Rhodopila globiformis]